MMYFSFYDPNTPVHRNDLSAVSYEELFQKKEPAANPMLPDVRLSGFLSCPALFLGKMDPLTLYTLLYVTEGEAELTLEPVSTTGSPAAPAVKCTIRAHTLLFLPPEYRVKSHVNTAPFSFKFYFLSGTLLQTYATRLTAKEWLHPDTGTHLQNHLQQLDRILQQTTADSPFFLTQCILNLLTECIALHTAPIQAAYPTHVLSMKQIFDGEYDQIHTLDQLEKRLHVNKYRLCRDFSQTMGSSPLQYLNQIRIRHAKQLLWQTNLTVQAVGSAVGIPNTSHFIRLFQRETGLTPLKYRSQRPFSPIS